MRKMLKSYTTKLTLLLLLTYFWSATAQIKEVDKVYYEVVYDEALESPVHVAYKVLCPRKGPASRKGMSFYTEPGVKTADNNDYYKNVWDKGHMAPAADFDCNRNMLHATFSYVNAALQHQSLNRGQWKDLEAYERRLATYGDVYVEITIEFNTHPPRVPSGAAIPSGFYKKITTSTHGTLCYYFPNKYLVDRDVRNYKIKCN